MNTFLPYADFRKSAQCLDTSRLGKQRVEGYQLLLGQFPAHPAARMWQGYRTALVAYTAHCCLAWMERGYKDTVLSKIGPLTNKYEMPYWFGDPKFHLPHQASLLRKYPSYYARYGWDVEPDLEYWWPPPL